MWNTSFVLPSLLVLVILLAYYFFRPRLANRMNKAFLILIVTDVATILTDVLATLADEQYEALPLPLVSLQNLLYFVSFIARILAFFYLTLVVLKLDIPRFSWIKHTASLVFILCEGIVLSSPFTGAV